MDSEREVRILAEAWGILATSATVREVARIFKVSKSTVHKDVVERLKFLDILLTQKVRVILDKHLKERSRNGGKVTRLLWQQRVKN